MNGERREGGRRSKQIGAGERLLAERRAGVSWESESGSPTVEVERVEPLRRREQQWLAGQQQNGGSSSTAR